MNQPNLIFTNMEPLPYTALKIKSDEVIHLSRTLPLEAKPSENQTSWKGGRSKLDAN